MKWIVTVQYYPVFGMTCSPYLCSRLDGKEQERKKERKIKENPTKQYNLEKTLNLLIFRKIQIKMMLDAIIYL